MGHANPVRLVAQDGHWQLGGRMGLNPATLALLLASGVGLVMLLSSSIFGWQILRDWDLSSGSALQLRLERRTYLVSTLLGFVFASQLLSLLLFIFNAESLSIQFVGAMCAVGTLNANPFGWPALAAKMTVFFLAAIWLILNHVDSRGYDYPLTRLKYALLLLVLPVMIVETYLQLRYFQGLDADVITSCCGSLFDAERRGVASEVAGFDPLTSMIWFYGVLAATVVVGLITRAHPRWGYLFGVLGVLAFVTALGGVISFVSLYVYEHPHHHCPFCILKPEYGSVGYLVYVPLFAATAFALGVAAIRPFHGIASLQSVVPQVSRRLVGLATGLYGLTVLWVTWLVVTSNLRLIGG